MLKTQVASFALLATMGGVAISGCKSPNPGHGVSSDPLLVVECSECRTIWVDGSDTYYSWGESSYESEERHACPDCRTAVENFFVTGEFRHSCIQCGDNIQVCYPVGG